MTVMSFVFCTFLNVPLVSKVSYSISMARLNSLWYGCPRNSAYVLGGGGSWSRWRRGLSCMTLKALYNGNNGSSVCLRMSMAWLCFVLLLVAYGALVGIIASSDNPWDLSFGRRCFGIFVGAGGSILVLISVCSGAGGVSLGVCKVFPHSHLCRTPPPCHVWSIFRMCLYRISWRGVRIVRMFEKLRRFVRRNLYSVKDFIDGNL